MHDATITGVPGRAAAATGNICLTFDDGPDPDWTPRVLDALAEHGMVATFFVIGCQARRQGALVKRVVAAGHEIGNHTWSHRHPWLLSTVAARHEVRDGARAIADLTGCATRLFRPPHGRLRACMLEEAAIGGQQLTLWNRSAVDWGPLGRTSGIMKRVARARAGDIILMHDGARTHNRPAELMAALPGFLAALVLQGLHPQPVPKAP
jgi:peptidoglycan/xylan/chitin deacetylase (PgdA/CDA1 family)